MPQKDLPLAHDWQREAEGAVSHILIPAAITAACGACLNYMRKVMHRYQQRAAVASSVDDIRRVMIAPDDPEKDDLRTIVEQTRVKLQVQVELLDRLTERFDAHIETQADRHAELKRLIQDSKAR